MKRKMNCTAMALLLATFTTGCVGEIKADTGENSTEDTILLTSSEVSEEVQALLQEDFFSNRDYRTEIENENPVTLTFNNEQITSTSSDGVSISGSVVTITKDGSYILTGDLTDGQVIINTENDTDKVQLVLNNVTLNNSTSSPINVVNADKVFVTTLENTENNISANISEDTSVDGGIFSKCDLTLNGNGILNIDVKNGDGIVAKDELTITSGTYNIIADGHGLNSNDGIAIANGTFNITAEKDGLHANHSTNTEKGYIFIVDGDFTINAGQDGIDTGNFLEINAGNFDITTNGGWENAPIKEAIPNTHGGGMMGGSTAGNRNNMGGMPQDIDLEGVDLDAIMGMREQLKGGMSLENIEGMEEILSKLEPLMQQIPQVQEMPQNQQMQIMTNQQVQGMPQGQQMQGMPQDQQMQGMPQGQQMPLDGAEMNFDRQDFANILVDENATETEVETTPSMKGLKSAGSMRIYDGTFNLDCYEDAIHSDMNVDIYTGSFNIGTGDDGIHANWNLNIYGGDIEIVNSFEGLEGQQIYIAGGNIDMYCIDDGINAASNNRNPEDTAISLTIAGGNITIDSNGEGDGLDSNGSLLVTGGNILVSSTMDDNRDVALDAQYGAVITGGTFIGTGISSTNIQNFENNSTQGSILVSLTQTQEGTVQLMDSNGDLLVDFTPAKEYSAVIISMPALTLGETYTLVAGEHTENITLSSLQYGSGGSSMMMNRAGR